MRILNVTQSYAPFFEFGGPPAKVKALAEGMARRGHQVSVLTADWGLESHLKASPNEPAAESSPFGRRRVVNEVTSIYLPTWLRYRAASWNPALGRYLRARLADFEIVHIFGLYDFLGPRVAQECRARRIPYLVEPIGMFVPIVRNLWLKRQYHRFFGRELLNGASAIVVTSDQERDELLASGVPREKVVLRRNGVEIPEQLPPRGSFRATLRIPSADRLVLFLGRLSQKKSPELLLKAFAGLDRAAGTRLVFVGPDESGMRPRLEQLAADFALTDRVHFCSALSGKAKWEAYVDADIFVLPSQNENFGNTAAEAVVAGTPVIVTESCGIAPLLDGTAGVVVRHDQGDLKNALEKLLTDNALFEKLQAGCAAAVAKLAWDGPLAQMESIYSALATRTSP
jgi:glycosyltransferase involved in cell wall biosynthesis